MMRAKTTPMQKAVNTGAVDIVDSLSDMFNKSFGPTSNVICFPRKLKGDFNAVAGFFGEVLFNANADFNEDEFKAYARQMKGAARVAAKSIMEDFKAMRESGCNKVILRVVSDKGYDENAELTEGVHLFHTDEGSRKKGRVLTCYTVAATEGFATGDAMNLRDADDFDACGERLYHEQGNYHGTLDDYLDFLYAQKDGYFVALDSKEPFSFNLGDIWRHAVDGNSDHVEPFIHRAPRTQKGALPRLLMVGDYPA